MISSKLTVVRGKGSQSEDWGLFDFLALPSPGDRIAVDRQGVENYATVLAVHHFPSLSGSSSKPIAEVVAKWTGSMPRLR